MLTFRTLLATIDIDPRTVRLVRHQDRGPAGITPWTLWRAQDGRFETYQRHQGRPIFGDAAQIAAFVVTPDQRTLFVGLYDVVGCGNTPEDAKCPLTGCSLAGNYFYDLKRSEALSQYAGRLFVDWGEGFRAWVQRAHKQDKAIIELSPEQADPPFPGFVDFQGRISEIDTLPRAWREALSSVRGIYLLKCPETGLHYVGSATGDSGLLGRWRDYAANGHGGNVRMKGRNPTDYVVTILEVASSAATTEDIQKRETLWKTKIGSRDFGLNAN
jgi:hypothetical protein